MSLDSIRRLLADLAVDEIGAEVQSELDAGTNPRDILKALTLGMDDVGKRYEAMEYYLTELVLAGETMKEAFKVLQPHLKTEEKGKNQTIVLATVKGDNHDIGKNILASMLMSAGYNIIDLGTNVDEKEITKAVKESSAKVLALSSLLTMTAPEIAVVDKALKDAGVRRKVKLIVGGAPLNMALAKKLGADDYADDAVAGVKHIKQLMSS
ncbi:MAG: cobalamin-dependent protein [Promethearchaeati archaeon SRVP18_Atabeyarchaeia-1]